jgi:hypothetical protein
MMILYRILSHVSYDDYDDYCSIQCHDVVYDLHVATAPFVHEHEDAMLNE